jgi:hypothetical protein
MRPYKASRLTWIDSAGHELTTGAVRRLDDESDATGGMTVARLTSALSTAPTEVGAPDDPIGWETA